MPPLLAMRRNPSAPSAFAPVSTTPTARWRYETAALVKKAVSGSGRADKAQVARMVQVLIGLRSLPRADATDALAVAITHGRRLRPMAARLVPAVVRP